MDKVQATPSNFSSMYLEELNFRIIPMVANLLKLMSIRNYGNL